MNTKLPNKIIRVSDGVEVEPIIAFKCPHCGENLEVPNYLIGKEIECGACCNEFSVTAQSDEPDGWEEDLTNQL